MGLKDISITTPSKQKNHLERGINATNQKAN